MIMDDIIVPKYIQMMKLTSLMGNSNRDCTMVL